MGDQGLSDRIGPQDSDDDEQYLYWPTSNANRTPEDDQKRPLVTFETGDRGHHHRRDAPIMFRPTRCRPLRRTHTSPAVMTGKLHLEEPPAKHQTQGITVPLSRKMISTQDPSAKQGLEDGPLPSIDEEAGYFTLVPVTRIEVGTITPLSRLSRSYTDPTHSPSQEIFFMALRSRRSFAKPNIT